MKLTKEQLSQVLGRIASFERLERRNTDLVGWISLGMGVSRVRAARMLSAARPVSDPRPQLNGADRDLEARERQAEMEEREP